MKARLDDPYNRLGVGPISTPRTLQDFSGPSTSWMSKFMLQLWITSFATRKTEVNQLLHHLDILRGAVRFNRE